MSEKEKKGEFGPVEAKQLLEKANAEDVKTCQAVIQDALKTYDCDLQYVQTVVNGQTVNGQFVITKVNK